ncbi:uncharacterized protein SEPMUDRAFT_128911 [Sphaerulina musiva SO2202]|uniref:Uncharacterized protein n=1 Tax=Sphaerulina musiva (strain SO2202) TaxID=692275 RepID=M3CWV6_SPHMS|nr:uncharacterized protein SEPMUDRAFT_128911 [Sphaerulina musiva SO2202]EMF08602.1 hypothetical protein SEPMUDRAFT_128911 [Sphaerulina musiva SO2202]
MATTSSAAPTTTTTSAPATTTSAESSSILSSISSAVSSSILDTTTPAPPPTTTANAPAPTTEPNQPVSTSTISESSIPATTQVITSIVTATGTSPGEPNTPVTVVITRTNEATNVPVATQVTATSASRTSSTGLQNTAGSSSSNNGGGGLSTAGVTAIAVVVPVVAVALLVLAGIFLWRKRKAKKAAEEARRKEVEDYGFNPNNDPTLPTVASENGAEMTEDSSGYRGWGAATGGSRKMSTTLTSGHTQGQLSDAGSNPYRGAGSGEGSDGHSGDAMLHQRPDTMGGDQVGDLGQAPIAGMNQSGMKRGPSNASSTYSAAGQSDVSDVSPPPGSMPQSYDAYNPASGFGYSQHGPYGDGTYGGASNPDGMPIVQDVSARRNTRIQQPGNYQQGGIAQNF